MHTVNNLLQTHNYLIMLDNFNIMLLIKKINSIHIILENFRTIPWVLCKIQLVQFERVKIESQNIWNFGSSLSFSGVILISFVMLNNNKTSFRIINAKN